MEYPGYESLNKTFLKTLKTGALKYLKNCLRLLVHGGKLYFLKILDINKGLPLWKIGILS